MPIKDFSLVNDKFAALWMQSGLFLLSKNFSE